MSTGADPAVDTSVDWGRSTKRRQSPSPSSEPEHKVRRISFADIEAPVLVEEPLRHEAIWIREDLWIASQTPSTRNLMVRNPRA